MENDAVTPIDVKILYVDDQESNIYILKRKLEKEAPGFSIDGIESAEKAMEVLSDNHYDCIIVDYNLGIGKNGIELLDDVKVEHPNIPVILLTSQGNEQVAADAFRRGAADYFTRKIGFAYFKRLAHAVTSNVEKARATVQKRRFEKLFDEAVKISPTPVFLIDSDRKIIYWNKACSDLTGVSTRDALGSDIYRKTFISGIPNFSNLPDLIFDRKIKDKINCIPGLTVKESREAHYEIEGYFTLSKGLIRYLRLAASPIIVDSGKIEAVIETVQDLTDIIRTREDLEQKTEQLTKLIENSPVSIYIHQDNTFKLFNKKLTEISGYSAEDLQQADIWSLVHPEDVEDMKTNANKRLMGDSVISHYPFRGITKDGKTINLIGYFVMIKYNKRPAILGQLVEEVKTREMLSK